METCLDMPLFNFTNHRGVTREFLAKPGTRALQAGGEHWHRCPVQLFAISGASRPLGQKEEVLRGYYREECSGRPWQSRFSKQRLKQIWSDER